MIRNISDIAKPFGIDVPVHITDAAFDETIRWEEKDSQYTGVDQSEQCRGHDLMYAFRGACARGVSFGTTTMPFQVRAVSRNMRNTKGGIFVPLKAVLTGIGANKVVTIMMTWENTD